MLLLCHAFHTHVIYSHVLTLTLTFPIKLLSNGVFSLFYNKFPRTSREDRPLLVVDHHNSNTFVHVLIGAW